MTAMLRRRTAVLCLLLTVLVGVTAPAPAQAGILDSIKNFFGGLFGHKSGSSANSNNPADFASILSQVQSSQQDVAAKQQAVSSIYNGPASGINPSDPKLQQQLNDLKSSTDANEQAYLAMLQARASAQSSGTDLSQYASQIQQLTQVQNQLETNYQKIQQANQSAGMFKPNASGAAGSATASASASNASSQPWNDPKGQQYIDEWLASARLNEWGQFVDPPNVQAAGPPDHGAETRYQYLWNNMQDDNAHSSMTLGEYVRAKMGGQNPSLTYSPPAGVTAPPPVASAPTAGTVVSPPADASIPPLASHTATPATGTQANGPTAAATTQAGSSSAGQSDATQLVTLEQDIAVVQKQLTDEVSNGQGTSDRAKQLQDQLSKLRTQKQALIQQLSNEQ